MALLAHMLPDMALIVPLTTKPQLPPHQYHPILKHKREREVDIISGTSHYPRNMPTLSLIYQGDESKIQIKIWEWCCIQSDLPYTGRKWREEEKRDFRDGEGSHLGHGQFLL